MTTSGVSMYWFGEPWPSAQLRASICEDDELRRPTPVGEPCMHCEQLVEDGDQGVLYPGYVDVGPDGEPVMVNQQLACHIECQIRNVMGCYGHLAGGPHSHDRDYRADALLVMAWLEEHGTMT